MTMRRFARWIASNSIWHHGNIQATEEKYRNIKRIALPAYDAVVILTGLFIAFNGGLPHLLPMLPNEVMQPLGMVLATAGAAALFGLAIPRFWLWELFGKALIVGIITSYVGALLILGFTEPSSNRLAVAGMAALGIVLPLLRMDWIGDEIKERREMGDDK